MLKGFEVLYEVLVLADVDEFLHILPLVGIANVDIHGMQLLQSLGLGGVAHPGVILQTILESLLQVFHQAIDTLLARLGEIFCHIELTDGLRQVVVDFSDGTLPAGLLLLYAADSLSVLKQTVFKSITQVVAVGVNSLQLHIGLQVIDTGLCQHLLHLVQRLQLFNIQRAPSQCP